MSDKPFIHLLKSSFGNYLYDVNSNQIIKISSDIYEYLNGDNTCPDAETLQCIEQLKTEGFLKADHVMILEHSVTECYSSFLKNNLSHITLQVTQNCNLNCEYCVYSGNYYNRQHSNKHMEWETAKKAIDYLVQHSQDADRLAISFYGGEPLLKFELIKKCVKYAEQEAEGRKISFNFTTNGTLLTKEKFSFLVTHDFKILISVDGPENIHDKHRKFSNGNGSFATMIKNITILKKTYPEYFQQRVSFNTVLDPMNRFIEINQFFTINSIFENMTFSSSLINDNYAKNDLEYSEIFIEEFEYEIFKLFLWKLGKLDREDVSPLILNYFSTHKRVATLMEDYHQDKVLWKNHRGGPCLPGVKKLFVSADGNLFSCERVSETSEAAHLGHIDQGVNLAKALEVLNIEQKTSEKCKKCWAYYFCDICVAKADDGSDISIKKINTLCMKTRMQVEQELLDYIALRELGYDRQLDL